MEVEPHLSVNADLNTYTLSSSSLNCMYMNIRSCRNKLDAIECLLANTNTLHTKVDVIVLTETWLYQGELFNLHGYDSYHCTRDTDRGGGVSIFVNNSLSSHTILKTQQGINSYLIVELINYNLKIFAVYNPGREQTAFVNELDNILNSHQNMLVFGDFNINLLNSTDNIVSIYTSIVQNNGFLFLNPLISNFYTRESNCIKTLIDHVFSDICSHDYAFFLLDSDPDLSDHRTIMVSVKKSRFCISENHKLKTVLSYENISARALDLSRVNSFGDFTSHLRTRIMENTKTFKIKKQHTMRKPYITSDLLQMIKRKNELYNASRVNPALRRQYLLLRNNVSNRIKWEKKRYYERQITNSKNCAELWKVIKELVFNKTSIVQTFTLKSAGRIINDEQLVCNEFNKYFIDVVESIVPHSAQSIVHMDYNTNTARFNFTMVREETLIKYIKELKPQSATGIDLISSKFLIKFKDILVPKLTELINSCIDQATFPDELKSAKITPIYKSGDKTNVSNYRPISVLNSTSKPFEKVLYNQIENYLYQNKLIHQSQFGFVRNSSTTAAAISLMNTIINSIDRGSTVSTLFIDLRKAFDCVNHTLLLNKLSNFGFSINAVNLIRSYLSNRLQCVKIGNSKSTFNAIKYGVPQGSILGPILFIIFINDIFHLPLKGKLQLYADDAAITYDAENVNELTNAMTHDLNLINSWFEQNKLSMNLEKTNFIVFSLRGAPPLINLSLNDTNISQVDCVDYLGLWIDQGLTWKTHILKVTSKINSIAFALRKIRKYISLDVAWNIYYAYIHPHFLYMNSIWGCSKTTVRFSLARIQNSIIKTIKKLPRLFPTNQLYSETLLQLSQLNKFEICVFFYKVINGRLKCNFTLISVSQVHNHNTRQRTHLHVHPSRTSMARDSVISKGIQLYNSLPQSIKDERSFNIFKSKLRSYLFNHLS